jgi:hypothetical protein
MLFRVNFEVKFVKRQVNMVVYTHAQAVNSYASFNRIKIILLCIKRLLANYMH